MPLYTTLINNTLETCSPMMMSSANTLSQIMALVMVKTESFPKLITSMEAYIKVLNASNPTLEIGIYTWVQGVASISLLSSGTVVPTVTGWAQVTLAVPQLLTAQTRYFFALLNRNVDATTSFGTAGATINDSSILADVASLSAMPSTVTSPANNLSSRFIIRGF